jgi:hypothetical protein
MPKKKPTHTQDGAELESKLKNLFKDHNSHFAKKWLYLFQETQNPIYAWKSYQTARGYGLPIPEEVLQYLDEVGRGILRLAQKPVKANQRPLAISKILGLAQDGPGAKSAFNDYTSREAEKEIAIETFIALQDTCKAYPEFEQIADRHKISPATVRRVYLEHKARWQQIADDLIENGIITFDEKGKAKMSLIGNARDIREAASVLAFAEQKKKTKK